MAARDGWRFVLDEAGRRELEAARVASDERTRLALNKLRRFDNVLPGRQGKPYLDVTYSLDGLLARVRVYFDDCFAARPKREVRSEGG